MLCSGAGDRRPACCLPPPNPPRGPSHSLVGVPSARGRHSTMPKHSMARTAQHSQGQLAAAHPTSACSAAVGGALSYTKQSIRLTRSSGSASGGGGGGVRGACSGVNDSCSVSRKVQSGSVHAVCWHAHSLIVSCHAESFWTIKPHPALWHPAIWQRQAGAHTCSAGSAGTPLTAASSAARRWYRPLTCSCIMRACRPLSASASYRGHNLEFDRVHSVAPVRCAATAVVSLFCSWQPGCIV